MLALLFAPGCGVQQAEPAPDIPPTAVSVRFQAVAELQNSGLDRQAVMTVRTAAEWEDLWSTATAPVQPATDPPAVDFTSRMVLVVALGRRATGGFDVRIGSVFEDGERLYVVYTETSPGEGCLTTQAFSAPISAVSVPSSGKPVNFVRRTNELACG